ncbi:MAG: hypothetical protein DCF22_18645 [Leptolyngbya sp.]|nr:MAG: hypothetical protein DCF22_18645 [Leptolyngbya sp.]
MTLCPCCAHLLLRHIRRQQVYWFCRQCWQEMPALKQETFVGVPSLLEAKFSKSVLTRSLVSGLA